jgi:hypothetical protein
MSHRATPRPHQAAGTHGIPFGQWCSRTLFVTIEPMKSSTTEWLERAWVAMCALAPYLALFLLPGGSLLVFILVVSRHGRTPTTTLAIADHATSLATMLFGKLPNNLYLGNHSPFFAYRSISGGRVNERNHRNGTQLATESCDMGR